MELEHLPLPHLVHRARHPPLHLLPPQVGCAALHFSALHCTDPFLIYQDIYDNVLMYHALHHTALHRAMQNCIEMACAAS